MPDQAAQPFTGSASLPTPVYAGPVNGSSYSGLMAAEYAREAGWVMTAFNRGEKGPKGKGYGAWQRLENCVVPEDWHGGIGLVHAHSGTCAIDVDDLDQAREWLAGQGVDLDALLDAPDAVRIVSGRPGRAKLLYRLPFPMVSKFVKAPSDDGGKSHQIVDFRCATHGLGAGKQDVLPPSIHPDLGTPYQWGGRGDWRNLPLLPAALARVWTGLLDGTVPDGSGRRRRADGEVGRGVDRGVARDPDRARAVEALAALDPDLDRETWVQVGMALQAAGGTWEDYDEWSAGGEKYQGPEDTRTRWDSFRPDGGVGPGTLYHMAMEAGWVPPERTPEGMFAGPVPEAPPAREWGPGTVAGVDGAADGGADPTLIALGRELEEAHAGATTEEVQDLVRRLALLGIDQLDAERRLKRLATATASPIGELRKEYRKEQRATGTGRKAATVAVDGLDAGVGIEGRLARAAAALSAGVASQPMDFPSLAGRFVWVACEEAFMDRLTRHLLSATALNRGYSHLRWSLTKGAGGGGDEDGGGAEGGPPKPADVLSDSPASVKVEYSDYWPGITTPVFAADGALVLNTWRQDGLAPRAGDVTPWLDLLAWLLPDAGERRHLIQWMAHCLRHQDQKINHNVVMGGLPRIGKDTLFRPLLAGLGQTNTAVLDTDKLEEPYQDAFVHKKVVVLNELHCAGLSPRKVENKLKPFGAAPPDRITLRRFGRPAIEQRNIVQLVGFSNHRTALSMETSAERWFAVWCAPEAPREPGYYADLYQWLDQAGGSAAVVYHLLHEVDLAGFVPGQPAPETAWRSAMSDLSQNASPIASVIADMIEERTAPFDTDLVWSADILAALQGSYELSKVNVNRKSVASALTDMGCVPSRTRPASGKPSSRMAYKENGKVKKLSLWAVRETKFWAYEYDPKIWLAASPAEKIPSPPEKG